VAAPDDVRRPDELAPPRDEFAPPVIDEVDLLDYRRRVADLYAGVRREGAGEGSWHTWRRGRDELLGSHPASPFDADARAAGIRLSYYPYDPRLHVGEVEIQPAEPITFEIGHSAHGATPARRFGTVTFDLEGAARTLSVFWLEGYGNGAFLPFRDATSGDETYGAGRYLLDTVKSADLGGHHGRVVLDLNFAYHPSCVHDPRWSCPLAPPENHLEVAVRGGERLALEGRARS
jgi:uncharacterized protein